MAWMADRPLRRGGRYLLRHTTRRTRCVIGEIRHRLDLAANQPQEAELLELNDIGRITLRTAEPLAFTPYGECRSTGAFVLIDEATFPGIRIRCRVIGAFLLLAPQFEGAPVLFISLLILHQLARALGARGRAPPRPRLRTPHPRRSAPSGSSAASHTRIMRVCSSSSR